MLIRINAGVHLDLHVLCILEDPGSNVNPDNGCTGKNIGVQTLKKNVSSPKNFTRQKRDKE
jgi:hypothetical protein